MTSTGARVAILALLTVLLAGCQSGVETVSNHTTSPEPSPVETTRVHVDPVVGQPLTDDTPFGSPPQWVFQAQGGWSIDRMDGATSQMTQSGTGCHLTLQARKTSNDSRSDAAASRAELKSVIADIKDQFHDVQVRDTGSLILRTLPTSKDPNTGIEFVRTRVDYAHATEPTDWSVVIGVRAFVVDEVILVTAYSCPRAQLQSPARVDALLAKTARINSD